MNTIEESKKQLEDSSEKYRHLLERAKAEYWGFGVTCRELNKTNHQLRAAQKEFLAQVETLTEAQQRTLKRPDVPAPLLPTDFDQLVNAIAEEMKPELHGPKGSKVFGTPGYQG